MAIKNLMATQAIPERVYALCKLVQRKQVERTTLRELVEPKSLNTNVDIFNYVFNLAESAQLIGRSPEGAVMSLASTEELDSLVSFRRLMAKKIFRETDELFVQFTAWYISQDEEVFRYSSKTEELAKALPKDFVKVDTQQILGWRFWASFLGIGFMHDTFIIPNMAIRIEDALLDDKPSRIDQAIPFESFLGWLEGNCPECKRGLEKGRVPLAISNGLRILHDQKKIVLRYVPDSAVAWELYPVESHDINRFVTDITIKGELYEQSTN